MSRDESQRGADGRANGGGGASEVGKAGGGGGRAAGAAPRAPASARFVRATQLYDDQAAGEMPVHAADSGGAAAAVSPAVAARGSSLATLLAGHVLRDGEVVLLLLKPSLWFVVFQSILVVAGVAAALLAARL